MESVSDKNTFVVQLLNTRHQSWQGTVTWLETKKTQPFRSLLELVKLMDSAAGNPPPGDQPS